VLLDHLEKEISALDRQERKAARRLLVLIENDRQTAQRSLLEALTSDRYRELLARLQEATVTSPVRSESVPVRNLAKRAFRKLQKQMRSVGPEATDAELHRARIAGKRARYAAELAEPLVGKPASRFVKRAKEFVGKLDAAGSTALNDALVQAAELVGKRSDRPAMVIFLTDGMPTAGETDNEKIIKNVAKANHTQSDDDADKRLARVFIFGVGDDVNTHLLDKLAEGNGGATNYVRPSQDIEEAVSSLYAKMSHPVLSGVKVKIANVDAHAIYPIKLPDLFVGNQVVLVGRYDGSGGAAITLSGTAGGKEKTYAYETTFPKETAGNAFLARVWATRRIGYLLDQIRLNGESEEARKEVVALALKFGIVTPYTSALVQEDKVVAANAPAQQRAFESAAAAPGRAYDTLSTGAPAPAAPRAAMKTQTGGGAVHAAQSVQLMKEGAQVQGQFQTYQTVGRRTFFRDSEWWTDSAWKPQQKVLKVKAFSQAYFDLIKARPELAQYLALGPQVQVQMSTLGLQVGPEGLDTLTPEQLDEIKK
jgi:Ca-activated chloride channel family protein